MKVTDYPEYINYCAMKQRCYNKNSVSYKDYGAKGITVAERWKRRGGFYDFLKDMGPKPTPKHTVDRIDSYKGYNPRNCRWATPQDQANNRRRRSDNTSGSTGLTWDKVHRRWVVRVTIAGKRICLGYFKSRDDALDSLL